MTAQDVTECRADQRKNSTCWARWSPRTRRSLFAGGFVSSSLAICLALHDGSAETPWKTNTSPLLREAMQAYYFTARLRLLHSAPAIPIRQHVNFCKFLLLLTHKPLKQRCYIMYALCAAAVEQISPSGDPQLNGPWEAGSHTLRLKWSSARLRQHPGPSRWAAERPLVLLKSV